MRRPPTAAFTLIELMIAIALGTIILMTAFAAVRTTALAVASTKRLALENQLLRIGVEQALEEVDFWTTVDDPEDPANQKLRGSEGAGGRLPFAPFQNAPDAITGGTFIDPTPSSTAEEPGSGQPTGVPAVTTAVLPTPHGGWNPNPLAWAACNPRTWPRSLPAEESNTSECWGTGGIYDNLDPTRSWHHWYAGQVRGLLDALGFYGAYDYLPSSAFLVYHGAAPRGCGGGTAWGGVPAGLIANGGWLSCKDGDDNSMKGRIRNTNGSRYFLPAPGAIAPGPFHVDNVARTWISIGYNGRDTTTVGTVTSSWNDLTVQGFLANSAAAAALLASRPQLWPEVSFAVRRFIEHGHPIAACQVLCRSPLTGESFVVPFACLGPTLRGARQQRRSPNAALPGWVQDPASEATLDYEAPP